MVNTNLVGVENGDTVRVKNIGLRGVTVADTKISFIDGEKGILIYRGYRIEELAERSSFMEIAYLLLHGALPDRQELDAFTARVVAARQIPEFILDSLKNWPASAHPWMCCRPACRCWPWPIPNSAWKRGKPT